MDSGDLAIACPVLGLAIGATFATMNNSMPFVFDIVSWLAFFFVIYKGISAMAFAMLGIAWGTLFAAMADLLAYDFVILMWLAFFFVLINSESNPGEASRVSPTKLTLMPMVLITIGGIIGTANPDFVNTVGNGFQSNWLGCQTTCSISPFLLFGSSIFQPLTSGNLIGFVTGLFTNVQGIATILSAAISILLLLLGLGIGGTVSVFFASLGITIDDAGARLCQSLGITMSLWTVVYATFGGWLSTVGNSWGLAALLPLAFSSVTFYGGYLQGKSVT